MGRFAVSAETEDVTPKTKARVKIGMKVLLRMESPFALWAVAETRLMRLAAYSLEYASTVATRHIL